MMRRITLRLCRRSVRWPRCGGGAMPEIAPMGMREQSAVWGVLATAVAVIGIPGGFAALVAMMQIDNANTLGHMSAAQDFVAIAAFAIGLAGISGGSLFLAMRWWTR